MAVLSFWKAEHRKDVLIWGWFCISVLFWGIGGLMATTTLSYDRAYLGWQIANICSILTPVIFLHFVFAYCRLNKNLFLTISYLLSIFFLIVNFFFKEQFFGNLWFAFNEFYYIDWSKESGYLYSIFYILFFGVIVFYAFFLLWKDFVYSKGARRNQTKYLLISLVLGWIGGHGDFLSAFNHHIYPYSNFLVAIYPVIAGYAIIRHQLLDINIVIRKGISYSIVITSITILYFLVILLSEKFFRGFIGYNSNFMSLGIVLVIAILFTPLKDRIQRFVDMRFFKGSLPKLAEENIYLRQEVVDKEKFKAVSTLASGLAHEIKNPLTAIKTFSEYLPLKRDDPEFIEKFSRIVGKEVTRINDLVHQLLDFAKPSAAVMKDLDLHELINDVLDFLSNQWVGQRIKLTKNFFQSCEAKGESTFAKQDDHSPLMIHADSNQLKQVFLNLFSNAIEAMPCGGVLTVETGTVAAGFSLRTLKPATTAKTSAIQITIADTGSGIAPETLKNLFNPFYTTKEKGTGLGLSVSKTIIENHKGKIKVESQLDKGTKFVIELPMEGKDLN